MTMTPDIGAKEFGHASGSRSGKFADLKVWCVVLLAAVLFYGFIYSLYWDKYQTGGNAEKYDISAEIYKRLLFTEDIEQIDEYALQMSGTVQNILKNGYGSAITDERPLYFFYLAVIKSFQTFPLGLNFALNALCLIAALVLLGHALNPPNKPAFVLLGAFLISPFILHQGWVYEPHVLELFLSCAGIFFYTKGRFAPAFFFMTLSLGMHTGNLVLFGCLGLYHLYSQRWNWRAHGWVALGVLAGLLCIEGLYWILFSRDAYGVLPHDFFLERMFFSSVRTAGGFATSSGALNFFRNALVYLPLGIIGAFWVRSRFQFFVTLLPLIVYLIATKGMMPGVHRVLLPVFFLGYGFFLLHFLSLEPGWRRRLATVLLLIAAASSITYHSYTAGCLSLRDSGPVSVKDLEGKERGRLHRNLSRFNQVVENAPTTFVLAEVPLLTQSNIPDPILYYPHFLLKVLHATFPEQLVKRLGLHDPRVAKSVLLQKRTAPALDEKEESPPDRIP
jgi:hypothetical protein